MSLSTASHVTARPESFSIKGALLPLTLLEVKTDDLAKIEHELTEKVGAASAFFEGSPVVLDIEGVGLPVDGLEQLVAIVSQLGMCFVGIKGGDSVKKLAKSLDCAYFSSGKVKSAAPAAPVLPDTPAQKVPEAPPKESAVKTRTVTTPVRSGQQVYSEGDLLVLAPVSAGAELLAVGNIYIYGPMRGRALAGVKGDESARIFCMSQEAELVSIAGHFMIDENLKQSHWKVATHIHFDGDALKVEPIAGSFF